MLNTTKRVLPGGFPVMPSSIRVHIESASGVRLLSGRLIDKDEKTHIAIVQLDRDKALTKINLAHYCCRGTIAMPNTLYFRRVVQENNHASQ